MAGNTGKESSTTENNVLDANFNPQEIEAGIYQSWLDEDYFSASDKGQGADPYCIVIPPPNVTGTLHMGHAFQHTLMDALTRYHRMKGAETLWQMGMDHAGIATQMLVQRQLENEGTDKHKLGRDKFIERVWQWKNESGGQISGQLKRLGCSLDWSRERFTMDEGFSAAVQEVFIRLYDEDLIYRGKRLVNWDPQLETAISDLEVISEETQGNMWHFRYPLANCGEYLVVATTRPETMLGDTAVAVHPKDERYAHLIGETIQLPLTDRLIPIIGDPHVDPEFGTGCVKITPAHDFDDYQMGQRHNLPQINIFTSTAHIVDDAPEAYRGLERFDARKRIIADLEKLGLLDKTEPHKLMVPKGDRSGATVEPWLTDQWFVKIQPLADPAIKAVEDGDIEFIPKQYANTYFSWMRDIKDWCISRQLWWGHRIPAWYDDQKNSYVGASEAEVRKKYSLGSEVKLRQDEDVLETWFSSALWSFATMGWPDNTNELKQFHPTSVLVTGHDIIFFWVARMIMMSLKFTGEVPFRQVYIHGLVKDSDGHKMSKSKGNGIDPLDIIDGISVDELVEKRTSNLMQPKMAAKIGKLTRKEFPDGIPAYGTDAVRFTYCALASTGRDIRWDMQRVEGYRNFCNKLWNASKFVLMNVADKKLDAETRPTLVDRWIISRAHDLLRDSTRAIESYRFDLYANHVYEFAWHEYCDWYLELSKPALWDESDDNQTIAATRYTLAKVLEVLLRIAHPIIPFITETLWQRIAPELGNSGKSIMVQAFPKLDELPQDEEAVDTVEWLKDMITGLRNIRGEQNIKPSQTVPLLLQAGSAQDRKRLAEADTLFKRLAKVDDITWLADSDEPPPNAMQIVGDLKVMVPLAGLIDVVDEIARLNKETEKLSKELKGVNAKLANEKFVSKAPEAVVAKEKARALEIDRTLKYLDKQMIMLKGLPQK
ncbi:MAG: valine--tRNA ligase [Pseudomonadales bacterium]|nr:valine--tRNA ligase [Pseudomonadales bacterium]